MNNLAHSHFYSWRHRDVVNSNYSFEKMYDFVFLSFEKMYDFVFLSFEKV